MSPFGDTLKAMKMNVWRYNARSGWT